MADKREKLCVGRYWDEPKIYACVDSEKIEMRVWLDDFMEALAKELGAPWVWSEAAMKEKLIAASARALEEIKKASHQVV